MRASLLPVQLLISWLYQNYVAKREGRHWSDSTGNSDDISLYSSGKRIILLKANRHDFEGFLINITANEIMLDSDLPESAERDTFNTSRLSM